MKIAAFTMIGFMTFASNSFGLGLKETFDCESKSNIQFNLTLENRSDIEISNYDSTKHKDSKLNGLTQSRVSVNGQVIPTNLKALAVVRGQFTDIYAERGGKICNTGVNETGLRLKAAVTILGEKKRIDFVCNSQSLLPEGQAFCE